MAEGEFVQIFDNLRQELVNVSNALTTQGISGSVLKFDGKRKQFREWMTSIEKFSTLMNIAPDRKKYIAYQSASGAVSEFINRCLTENPGQSWEELKYELRTRFSDVTDPYIAISLLRNIKQGKYENIQIYSERLMSLAADAYQGRRTLDIEKQLLEFFIDGLYEDSLKLKLLRNNVGTLAQAVNMVITEQNLIARIKLSSTKVEREETPMEIDHSRKLKSFKCKVYGHKTSNCEKVSEVKKKEIVCWGCGKAGHVIRNCRQFESKRKSKIGYSTKNE